MFIEIKQLLKLTNETFNLGRKGASEEAANEHAIMRMQQLIEQQTLIRRRKWNQLITH